MAAGAHKSNNMCLNDHWNAFAVILINKSKDNRCIKNIPQEVLQL